MHIDRLLVRPGLLAALLVVASLAVSHVTGIFFVFPSHAQHGSLPHSSTLEADAAGLTHHGHGGSLNGWEGSSEGIAYSERNHHIAGWFVILMALTELGHALRLPYIRWTKLLLPTAMTGMGLFLLIWSDHEAWPVGSMSFTQTFFGHDQEILQHKAYGVLALLVGGVEFLRRTGCVEHVAWAIPLPTMAIVGGFMLFGHSHGIHPSADLIAAHHAIMGALAISAGSSKLYSGWQSGALKTGGSRWEILWAGLILLIGMQLLIYSE
ncbi:conserved membrane protein of unknown function [Nitrospira sp. KM1]|uniref:hypothetical protein n=1 Tax=Nitrospira sp. KM1 TaxID=1936990 RepID=UPI0013A79AC9|nr:hypothetical protein [Nitrospira sp. KM1]BCA55553.1 conserved membrane protein of unknown function [Nitrospira sp. KM1]